MSVKYYSYPADKDVQLSAHFKMGEFVDPSDYTSAPFPSTVPIDSDLIDILEQVREHFGCTFCNINSGYRTPAADISNIEPFDLACLRVDNGTVWESMLLHTGRQDGFIVVMLVFVARGEYHQA